MIGVALNATSPVPVRKRAVEGLHTHTGEGGVGAEAEVGGLPRKPRDACSF